MPREDWRDHCKIAERLQVDVIERVWYGSGDSEESEEVPRRLEMSTFDEGTIIIDFAKPDSTKRVWRGIARGRVAPNATPEQLRKIVDQSVREILGEFPPAA